MARVRLRGLDIYGKGAGLMAWVDDRIWCHPKFVGLTAKAFRVWVHGTTYSSGFGTRGTLTLAQQATIGCTSKAKLELVAAGLWHHGEDGSVDVNDWEEHNGKRDDRRVRERDRLRARRAALREDADGTRNGTQDRRATDASATRVDGVTGEEVQKQEQKPRAVPLEVDEQPSNGAIAEIIKLSLGDAA